MFSRDGQDSMLGIAPKEKYSLKNKYGLLPLLLMWILFLVIQSKNPKNFTRFLPVILEKCQ